MAVLCITHKLRDIGLSKQISLFPGQAIRTRTPYSPPSSTVRLISTVLPTNIPSASHCPQSGALLTVPPFLDICTKQKKQKKKVLFQTSLTKAKTDLKPAQLNTGIKVSPPY